MAKYYFIGNTESLIAHIDPSSHAPGTSVKLNKLGQSIEATPEEVESWGAPLLPEDQWKSLGFSDEQLKQFDTPGKRINAPSDIKEKLTKAYALYGEIWQKRYEQRGFVKAEPSNPIVETIADLQPAQPNVESPEPLKDTKFPPPIESSTGVAQPVNPEPQPAQ